MVIDNEFKNLLPPLSEDDYKGLEESLKKDGCRDHLVVWGDILVDGHNRYQICTENNIPFQTVRRDFKDRDEVILWIVSNQLSRRNLTAFQRSELALRLKPKLESEAKERMEAGNNQYSPSQKNDEGKRTDEKLGEIAGVSRGTIRNTETILTKGTTEDIKEVRDGKASISGKAKEIKARNKSKEDDIEEGIQQENVVDNVLKYTIYNMWKTLNGFEQDYCGQMSKTDEKSVKDILKRLQDLLDKKGGIYNETSK